jgi:hypothetical protein
VTADPPWTAFREAMFGEPYLVWHDGPDFTLIADRYAGDPELVQRELAAGIAEGDALAAQACRELGASDEQKPALVELLERALPSSSSGTRTEIATSLHALGSSSHSTEDLAQEVCDVLLGVDHWGVRLDAAMRLASFAPTARLVEAAAAGVRDEEYLVRYHCANTLLQWAGRPADISADDELFRLLVDDGGPEGWAEVARRLSEAVHLPM